MSALGVNSKDWTVKFAVSGVARETLVCWGRAPGTETRNKGSGAKGLGRPVTDSRGTEESGGTNSHKHWAWDRRPGMRARKRRPETEGLDKRTYNKEPGSTAPNRIGVLRSREA